MNSIKELMPQILEAYDKRQDLFSLYIKTNNGAEIRIERFTPEEQHNQKRQCGFITVNEITKQENNN